MSCKNPSTKIKPRYKFMGRSEFYFALYVVSALCSVYLTKYGPIQL